MSYIRVAVLAVMSLLAFSVVAIPINTQYVVNEGSFNSSAFDNVTGKYYRSKNYNSAQLYVYDNKAQFEANIHTGIVNLQGGTYGSYFEVHDGKVYSRHDSHSGHGAVWDVTTGAKQNVRSFPYMGGQNGNHTFNWGGYSGVNFMEDLGNLYVMGKNTNNTAWQINKLDTNMNILSTVQYTSVNRLGYAFIINDILFSSDTYNSNIVNSAINLKTGNQFNVNFELQGMGSVYLSGVNYVGVEDTLYFSNTSGGNLFKVENASQAFNAPAPVNVSEPGALALFGLGLFGLGLARRKSKA